MPNATRLPILNDRERHAVGLCYKQKGPEAAQALGHSLVCGDTKKQRVDAWLSHLQKHPDAVLYCWRGGLRSQIAQTWLREAGVTRPRVRGGYKALRQSCIDILESANDTPMLILSGRTGSGKTDLLVQLEQGVDLEGAARHRGSAFGQMPEPQPEPAEFEARLAIALVQKAKEDFWVLEDEGRMIGRLAVPPAVRIPMTQAPVVVMDVPLHERIEQIYGDYVRIPLSQGFSPAEILSQLQACLDRVRRRLGGERHARIQKELSDAFSAGDGAHWGSHAKWIGSLLTDYYDPMYDYSIESKRERTVFRGSRNEVLAFLRSYQPKASSGRSFAPEPQPRLN